MHRIIKQQHLFLNTTTQRIVANLNDIDKLIEVDLIQNKNNYIDDTGMTIRKQFMDQVDSTCNSLFAIMENTKVAGSYYVLFHERKANAVDIILTDLDPSSSV
jgi:hypothetical protein